MDLHQFDYAALSDDSHRPWPLPRRPWFMTQSWHDLLFAHWAVERAALHERIPRPLELDEFDGRPWIGVVPFFMTNVGPRGVPSPRRVSSFPELNVRTYVRANGRPGVYFFSLDAGSALATRAARALFNLPYYTADMRVVSDDVRVSYASRRRRSTTPADFEAVYRPTGPVVHPRRGTLEYFLTERYCLYGFSRAGHPYRLEIHHPPWPLQAAEGTLTECSVASASGLTLPDTAPLLHFAKRQDVVAWLPTRIGSRAERP
jgi:uncharacterized protein YqjF (DUF2071 family)